MKEKGYDLSGKQSAKQDGTGNYGASIGRNIAQVRILRGLSQAEVAAALGVSKKTLSRIERCDEVDLQRLDDIAEVLGTIAEVLKKYSDETAFGIINSAGSKENASGLQKDPGEWADALITRQAKLLKNGRDCLEIFRSRK